MILVFKKLSDVDRHKYEINYSKGSDSLSKPSPKCINWNHSIDEFMSSESKYIKFKYSCYQCYRDYYKHNRDSYEQDRGKYKEEQQKKDKKKRKFKSKAIRKNKE